MINYDLYYFNALKKQLIAVHHFKSQLIKEVFVKSLLWVCNKIYGNFQQFISGCPNNSIYSASH